MNKKLINIFYCILTLIIIFPQNTKADNLFDQGKQIFIRDGYCATCHALKDAGSDSVIGPNLNEIKPDIKRIISAVTNGIGVMPSYSGQLSKDEIKAVATYVSQSVK
jgi:cytochrome c6|tara:strand:+ start:1278 stop:1598 length:321 start_codon:yes stop_codon:yes gene_type:complete